MCTFPRLSLPDSREKKRGSLGLRVQAYCLSQLAVEIYICRDGTVNYKDPNLPSQCTFTLEEKTDLCMTHGYNMKEKENKDIKMKHN